MGSFDIKSGLGGVAMSCNACYSELTRDPSTGNYKCTKPGCGKGGISAPGGVQTTVDADGNVLLTSGKKPS